MTSSEKKPVLIVFVEGRTDRLALKRFFEKALGEEDRYLVKICRIPGEIDEKTKMRGKARSDITSDMTIPLGTLCDVIYEGVRFHSKSESFEMEDVIGIVQLVDTDGAYINDSQIISDSKFANPFYDTENKEIRVRYRKKIVNRNKRKSFNMDLLSATTEIHGIPYRLFYMSCNLDHVLHNEPNNTDKVRHAKAFAHKYGDDADGLLRFLVDFLPNSSKSYEKSWKYLKDRKQPNHSLERGSNLATIKEATVELWE